MGKKRLKRLRKGECRKFQSDAFLHLRGDIYTTAGKYAVCAMCIVCLLLSLVSCGKENDATKTGSFTVYELNTASNALSAVSMDVNGKTTEEKVDEVAEKLYAASEDGEYKAALPANVELLSRRLRKGILSLDFSAAYNEMSGAEPLIRAAIVRSFCGIDGVDAVRISVDGVPLTDALGNVIGEMTEQSFVYDFEDGDAPDRTAELLLYFESADGSGLLMEKRTVDYNSNTPLGRVVLKELTLVSDENETPLPMDINVTSYAVSDGICYITFDSKIAAEFSESPQSLRIYSIVNSLTELDSISKVMLTVEGENGNGGDIGGLYEKDKSLVLP